MPRPLLSRPAALALPFTAVALTVIAAFGAYLRFIDASALGIDEWWRGIASVSRGSAPFAVAVFYAEIGASVGAIALGALAVALLLVLRRGRGAATVATALLLGVLASESIKSLVMRPRPGGALYATHGSSYPSGHSMGAAALAVSIALVVSDFEGVRARTKRLTWCAAVAWVLLMMWSRTALHVHWLSDTIAGALLGTAAALVAYRVWCGRRARQCLAR